jgi:hypothetical protein
MVRRVALLLYIQEVPHSYLGSRIGSQGRSFVAVFHLFIQKLEYYLKLGLDH